MSDVTSSTLTAKHMRAAYEKMCSSKMEYEIAVPIELFDRIQDARHSWILWLKRTGKRNKHKRRFSR